MATPADLDRLCVVLVRTRNPLNIGAAARAISNFGFKDMRVVQPYERAFREARSAVGAAALLAKAQEFASVAEAVADCSLVIGTTAVGERELQHPLRRLEEGARLIRRRMTKGRVALLFGSEKTGLSNEAFSHCDWLMRIPTVEKHDSMNLGQAVAVCLYELARQSRPARSAEAKKDQPASAGDRERLTELLLENLVASGYLQRNRTADAEARARRFVRRMQLSSRDAATLLGMLRQMAWKMGKKV